MGCAQQIVDNCDYAFSCVNGRVRDGAFCTSKAGYV
jgi:hypothetical protein